MVVEATGARGCAPLNVCHWSGMVPVGMVQRMVAKCPNGQVEVYLPTWCQYVMSRVITAGVLLSYTGELPA